MKIYRLEKILLLSTLAIIFINAKTDSTNINIAPVPKPTHTVSKEATSQGLRGNIIAIDTTSNTLTVKGLTENKTLSFTLNTDAKIRDNKKFLTLLELKLNTEVFVKYVIEGDVNWVSFVRVLGK